jgi:hypothetical protein
VECDPRIVVVPDHVRSAGPQIVKLARMAGIRLDESQRMLAEVTAGVDESGRWAAFEAVVFAPRQNLKTEFLLARILAGLYIFREELIVFSAHRASTTTKVFGRLKRAIERNSQLGSRIVRVSNRYGAESVTLASGQSVEMVARSTSSGRGFTGDCVILDESHELDSDQLAAILPMVATRKNPQVLYALSLGNDQTSHVGGLRERALAGKPGVCWVEWSMAGDDRVGDREVWVRCNPAVAAGRITMERLEALYMALGEDRFAREHLGRSEWPSGAPGDWQLFRESDWLAATTQDEDESAALPVPVPELVPAREFDPFEAWGPSGVPPWVGQV